MLVPTDVLIAALDADIKANTGKPLAFIKRAGSPRVFDDSHNLACAASIANSLFKKFLPESTTLQDDAALDKFLAVNKAAGEWELKLVCAGDEELFGDLKRVIDEFLHIDRLYPLPCDLDTIFSKGKVGPGANIGAVNGDFYSKIFGGPLTCSSAGLAYHYQTTIQRYPMWNSAEAFRAQLHTAPKVVKTSKLSFVPKNDTISRSICTEPTLNTFYQLGLGQVLTGRLRSFFGIDLNHQAERNARLARIGSTDGSWSTIDLESASDSISLGLCREIFPAWFMGYLSLLRSSAARLPSGEVVELKMVSSMGNGYTFPLQTLIFSAIVQAVYCSLEMRGRSHVFGDDIVVKTIAYRRVCRLLQICGFTVNTAKSFCEGSFRESCGRDYLNGRDIRGPYIKRLKTPQDLFAAINMLNLFTAKTDFALPNLVRCLMSKCERVEVPLWEDPSSGILTPLMIAKTTPRSLQLQGKMYVKYVFVPRLFRLGDHDVRLPSGRRVSVNPDGILTAAVGGLASSSGLPVRLYGRWKKKRFSSSSWDSISAQAGLQPGLELAQFVTAFYLNDLLK